MTSRRTSERGMHGEIVWSWRPGAGAKVAGSTSPEIDGGNKPVPGEITYKP